MTIHPYRYEDNTDGVDNDCDGGIDSADTDITSAGPNTDEGYVAVSLASVSIPFCGSDYTTLYLTANGRVTFGSADIDATETVADLGSDVMVAGAWDDLNPASGTGRAFWIEYADAVGFYWRNVRESGATTTNTFSIVLYDDGRIQLEYGGLAMTDGLAGFSCGGATTATSDLSAGMAGIGATWGLGDGTEAMYYELFSGTHANDLDNLNVRLCGDVDGTTDPCDGW
jgi:hypothetical protein